MNEIIDGIVSELESLKVRDILVYDWGAASPLADFFVIGTADSFPQLDSARQKLDYFMGRRKMYLRNPTEEWTGGWLVMDFGDVIVHVFLEEKRSFYHLDDFLKSEKMEWDETRDAVRRG